MTKIEFLQMVPALLFGISLAEIALFLGKSTKHRNKLYWEHIVLIIISFEAIVFNWYLFYDRLQIIESSYLNFLIQLISPLAALLYVSNILVENDLDGQSTGAYFLQYRKQICLSFAIFITISALTIIYFHPKIDIRFFPFIPIGIILINAFYDIKWLRIVAYCAKVIEVGVVCMYMD
jgi:hypothetical protein